jgi:hypothetical protein
VYDDAQVSWSIWFHEHLRFQGTPLLQTSGVRFVEAISSAQEWSVLGWTSRT